MTTNLRIRAYPFAPKDFKIFIIGSNGLEAPASPEHQRVLYDLENDRLPYRCPAPPYTLCIQTFVPRLSNPVFSLELPQFGSRYVLESVNGISQFYFEAINRFHGECKSGNLMGPIKFEPYNNGFFSGGLEPLPWTLFNVFSYLYPYNWSSLCMNPSAHGHYMVNIFFDAGVDQPEYNTSTAYCICDDTLLKVVFETLSREKLRGEFTLGQILYGDDWNGNAKRFFLKPYTYEEAWSAQMRMKDLDWKPINGNELHLWSNASNRTPL